MRRIIRFLVGIMGLLGAVQAIAQTPTPIPITGNLGAIQGTGQPYAGVSIQLQNCASPVAITGYFGIVQQGYQIRASSAGLITGTVWPNDLITCNGTTGNSQYAVTLMVGGTPSGTTQCYQVTSTQAIWNMNTQQPVACGQSPPNPQDAQYRNLNVTGCFSVDGSGCGGGGGGSGTTGSYPNVKTQFGAVGDGVTDDYLALNAAFSYMATNGGCVFFPPGKYRTNSPLNWIDQPNTLCLVGSGLSSYIIFLGTAPVDATIHVGNAADSLFSSVNLQNLGIAANANATYAFHAIRIGPSSSMTNVYLAGGSASTFQADMWNSQSALSNLLVDTNAFNPAGSSPCVNGLTFSSALWPVGGVGQFPSTQFVLSGATVGLCSGIGENFAQVNGITVINGQSSQNHQNIYENCSLGANCGTGGYNAFDNVLLENGTVNDQFLASGNHLNQVWGPNEPAIEISGLAPQITGGFSKFTVDSGAQYAYFTDNVILSGSTDTGMDTSGTANAAGAGGLAGIPWNTVQGAYVTSPTANFGGVQLGPFTSLIPGANATWLTTDSGIADLRSYGPNTTTKGTVRLWGDSSDDSLASIYATFTPTAVTLLNPLTAPSAIFNGVQVTTGTLGVPGVDTVTIASNTGNEDLVSFGPNSSTEGSIRFWGISSDDSLGTIYETLSPTAATFSNSISAPSGTFTGTGPQVTFPETTAPTTTSGNQYLQGIASTHTLHLYSGVTDEGPVCSASNGACGGGTFTALTGDATSTATGGATAVVGINGTLLSGLSTGLAKITTTTGAVTTVAAPTGAVVGTTDTQSLTNKSIAGSEINSALVGSAYGGTGVNNTATLTLGSSNQNWAALGTGIVKNTITTGAISDAAAADVYGLWSGSCSSSTFLRGDGACATPAGSGTINAAAQYDAPYYSAAGSATTLSGAAIAGFQFDSTSGAPAAATSTNLGTLLGLSAGMMFSGGASAAAVSSTDFTLSSHTVAGGASAILDLSAASTLAGLKIPAAAGAVPTADDFIAMNTTTHALVHGSNGTTIVDAAAATGTNTATTCTNQFLSAISSIAAPTCSTVALAALATQTADTFLANATAGTAAPTAVAMPTTNHGVWLAQGTAAAPVATAAGTISFPLVSGGASADPSYAQLTGAGMVNATVTATQLAAQYSKGSCTEVWVGSGTSSALTSGDDTVSNNTCYNDSGVTRTITAVKCRSDIASNTTTTNPTFGSSGTGTTILSGAITCGSSYAYSSTGTVSNASWTTGTGIDPAMAGTLTGTSIALIVEYTY